MDLRGSRSRRGLTLTAAAAAIGMALSGGAQGASLGPVADGPYVGMLPCADCAGIRTTLTLYTLGEGGEPRSGEAPRYQDQCRRDGSRGGSAGRIVPGS